MAIVTNSSGSIGLDDIEFGFRAETRSELIDGSKPPQYRSVTVWVAFARYDVGGEQREVKIDTTKTQLKSATGQQIAGALVAEIAAAEGVSEGEV